MKKLGTHLLGEFYGCDSKLLDDIKFVEDTLNGAAKAANATIVNSCFHRFSPYGISGVVIIAESHLTAHTYPEYNAIIVDVFTCGIECNPILAMNYIEDKFKALKSDVKSVDRGVIESDGE